MGLFSKQSFVGIDLGHHRLKAMQVEKTSNGWKVTKFASARTPIDSIRDGVVIDPKTLGGALKYLLKSGGINATSAHIAAAGGSVFVRPVAFPRMPEATLRKSIRFEASRFVPGSVEDSFIEFEILGALDDNQMNVLVVAAPKEIVESRLEACYEAGLEVESVDVEGFAMYRSLIEADYTHDWSDAVIAVVDVGASTTNMSVVNRGVFAMNRSIPNGGQTITDALVQYFKLDEGDAEAGKSQLDLLDLLNENAANENPPLRVVQPHVDDLIREVRRSLNYFQSQLGDQGQATPVQSIILAGGGAKLPGLPQYMEQKLGIRVICAGLFDNPRFNNASTVADTGLDLAVASGLAMRAFATAA